jgi:hypothetical protein
VDLTKRRPIRSKAITQAADGEACTICGIQDGTVVFCHLDELFAGKGTGQKADDIAGFFGCRDCHALYGGHKDSVILKTHLVVTDWEVLRALYRTWVRLIDKGVITIRD